MELSGCVCVCLCVCVCVYVCVCMGVCEKSFVVVLLGSRAGKTEFKPQGAVYNSHGVCVGLFYLF